VIEHPRWIPPERLAKLDVRAGDDKGRIYRVSPEQKPLRPIRDLVRLSETELPAAIDTPNGTERDRIHLELLRRFGASSSATRKAVPAAVIGALAGLSENSRLPEARLQALCTLEGLNRLDEKLIHRALSDSNAAVRQQAVRLSEPLVKSGNNLGIATLASDSDLRVRYQAALSLGESPNEMAGNALASIARKDMADPWMRAAVLSSARRCWSPIFREVLDVDPETVGRSELIQGLIATAAGDGDRQKLTGVMEAILPKPDAPFQTWQMQALAAALDALERHKISVHELSSTDAAATHGKIAERLAATFGRAFDAAGDSKADESYRTAAIRLLGRSPEREQADIRLLIGLLEDASAPVRKASANALQHCSNAGVPNLLLSDWNQRPPSYRRASIELMLGRPAWAGELLDAVERGDVGRNEIPLVSRQRLLAESNPALKEHATKIWAANPTSSRTEVLAKYRAATPPRGDVAKGAVVFSANCSQCHLVHGIGHGVGPDLAALADKSPDDLLTSILDPNAAVEPRFIAYNVQTRDGRTLTGVISAETSTSLTVVQPGGLTESLLRADIQGIRASGVSLMPEGLEQAIPPEDLAHLIAYLKSPLTSQEAAAKK
jgi:putative heme-binding domain-containing protein